MRRAGFLVVALLAVSGQACQAGGGKTSLPIKVPKFVQAGNGLPFQAAFSAGEYLTRVILHFAGLDPPVDWVPPPTSAELFPDWVDDQIAAPAGITGIGTPACGAVDIGKLAARLRDEPAAPAADAPSGLLRIEPPKANTGDVFDSRAVYGAERRDECFTGG